MAVFFDTGGGDIYAGPTREAVIAAMREDSSDIDESEVFEVSGSTKMRVTEDDRPTGETITLAEEYGDDDDAYMICTDNF